MSDFKEFQAKTLDQAIQDACEYFGIERVKLEIDIVEDAKSGIFGLVGARKASVKARLAPSLSSILDVKSNATKAKKSPTSSSAAAPTTPTVSKVATKAPKARSTPAAEMGERPEAEENSASKSNIRPPAKTPRSNDKRDVARNDKPNDKFNRQQGFEDDGEDESQRKFLSKIVAHDEEELDENTLEALDREAMAKAHMLGNMTEAEVRANGHKVAADRRNFRGKVARGHENTSIRSDRDRGQTLNRDNKRVVERSVAPRAHGQKDEKRDEALERRQFYEQKRQQQREANPPRQISVAEYEASPLPRIALEELDTERLLSLTRETILKLVGHIVGLDAPIEIKIADDRVHVSIESEDTGLLIGREGQHLAAVQYIASRILTRQMESQIRIQVDAGDYHSRQDARMEFLAQALAEKVKNTGRPQSTRPLSAYQRRVIHLALQEETEVQTRSCGDGTLKRVIIMRRRHPAASVANGQVENAEVEVPEDSFVPESD